MKKIYIFLALINGVLLVSACRQSNVQETTPSPSTDTRAAVNAGQGSSPNSPAAPEPANAANSNVGPAINSGVNTIIGSKADLKSANISSTPNEGGSPPADSAGERLRSRSRADRVPIQDPSATPPPIAYRKAPENSEFAAYMDNGGKVVETRLFKGHRQIQKAQVIWADPKNRILKVTLKNGRVVERNADRIASLQTVSSAEILSIINAKAN